ncbi:hypothetical protein DITRI_Ditri15bG0020900 [Diplodiscus trichospermus]
MDMVSSNLPQPYSAKHPFLRYLLRRWRKATKTNKNSPPWMRLYPRFTLNELITATDNFQSKIGKDGLSTLYKGFIKNSHRDTIASRRFEADKHECFLTEMGLRSHLHHPNIVSLMGYCADESESDKFIIYELEICIGAALGIEFLHTGNPSIIHRDISTSNILLDQNWVAKISNFGIAKLVPTNWSESDSHVSTEVGGTIGYVDPEYLRTCQLTKKSDVYSFGVVLFEVLSARKALHRHRVLEERRSLIQWCRHCVQDGRLDEIVDPLLNKEIAPECLKAYVDIAYRCSNKRSNGRPTIDAVVKRLQLTLLLQECVEAEIPFSPSWLRAITLPSKKSKPLVEI